MKTRNWVEDVRQAAYNHRTRLFEPGQRTSRNWPLCILCGRDVDAAGIRDLNAFGVEIWAQCRHLRKDCSDLEYEMATPYEDFYKVKFPFRIEGEPQKDPRVNDQIRRAMGDGCFFDPSRPSK